jgi:beta-glucanase (GH16 family)
MARYSMIGAILLALYWLVAGPLVGRSFAFVPAVEAARFSATPTWGDEFNSSSLDTSKWYVDQGGSPGGAVDVADAISVGGGKMTITLYTAANGDTHTGCLVSGLQRYGYFESRIRFRNNPTPTGSCFWIMSMQTNPPILGNPAVGGTEMDIAEHWYPPNNWNSKTVHHAVIWDGYGADMKISDRTTDDVGADSGYHTYGLAWDPSGCRFYVDDNLSFTCTEAISNRFGSIQLNSDIYLWSGSIPPGGFGDLAHSTVKTDFDYVRIYAIAPEPSALAMLTAVLIGALAHAWRKRKQ